ncbi:hypothetical protein Syn6312_0750 [Synechococcus sp. PCC 6312]|nr:hypothetical protein Syn6312_0750 [Synechococcus sp. PCC 6312]
MIVQLHTRSYTSQDYLINIFILQPAYYVERFSKQEDE